MSAEEYLFPLRVMRVTAAGCVSIRRSYAFTTKGERGVVQARSEQDFFAQTKFQSDEDSFLAASLFSVFVAPVTFLGPVDF